LARRLRCDGRARLVALVIDWEAIAGADAIEQAPHPFVICVRRVFGVHASMRSDRCGKRSFMNGMKRRAAPRTTQ